jgi:hypothetical protein
MKSENVGIALSDEETFLRDERSSGQVTEPLRPIHEWQSVTARNTMFKVKWHPWRWPGMNQRPEARKRWNVLCKSSQDPSLYPITARCSYDAPFIHLYLKLLYLLVLPFFLFIHAAIHLNTYAVVRSNFATKENRERAREEIDLLQCRPRPRVQKEKVSVELETICKKGQDSVTQASFNWQASFVTSRSYSSARVGGRMCGLSVTSVNKFLPTIPHFFEGCKSNLIQKTAWWYSASKPYDYVVIGTKRVYSGE